MFIFSILVLVLFTKAFCISADDSCNCDDLLKRAEQLEAIVYQNVVDNTANTFTLNPTSTITPILDTGIQTIYPI